MSRKFKVLKFGASFVVFSAALLFFVQGSTAEKVEYWISVDTKEYAHVRESLAKSGEVSLPENVAFERNGIALLQLNELQMEDLSRSMHDEFRKCSGFVWHQSREAAVDSISRMANAIRTRSLSITRSTIKQTSMRL